MKRQSAKRQKSPFFKKWVDAECAEAYSTAHVREVALNDNFRL